MAKTILVTGSNRGIGLEVVRQYAAAGWQVHACCRDPERATELHALATENQKIHLHQLDVTDHGRMTSLARELEGHPIDILFNNAGVYGQDDAEFGNTDENLWLRAMRINVIAPMKMMETFIGHVTSSQYKLIACLSSKMGSMADNGSGGSYVYRSSKAALNAVLKSAAIDLQDRGIRVAILHPGWVKTGMGGPHAEISTTESVTAMRAILTRMKPEDTGTFYDIDGRVIPW
ncbi:MAG TPA: SDR family oxidoreductase [Gammaproteobacteria bacterium]|nr:SDR family oxidoreductase [Gammaproteobacteria bacterium]